MAAAWPRASASGKPSRYPVKSTVSSIPRLIARDSRRFEAIALRPIADDADDHRAIFAAQFRGGVQQDVDALFANEPPDICKYRHGRDFASRSRWDCPRLVAHAVFDRAWSQDHKAPPYMLADGYIFGGTPAQP
jgi:hypothetical protein